MFDFLEKTWNYITGDIPQTFGSMGYQGFSTELGSSLVGDVIKGASAVGSFLDSPGVSTMAGIAAKTLFGESGSPEFKSPKAQRVTAPRTSAGSQLQGAGRVDMGFTAKALKGGQTAYQKAPAGSSIRGTFNRIQAKKAHKPLLAIQQTPIRVRRRAT